MNKTHNAEVGTAQVPRYFSSDEIRMIADELVIGIRCISERLETLKAQGCFPCGSLLEKAKAVRDYSHELAEVLEMAEEMDTSRLLFDETAKEIGGK